MSATYVIKFRINNAYHNETIHLEQRTHDALLKAAQSQLTPDQIKNNIIEIKDQDGITIEDDDDLMTAFHDIEVNSSSDDSDNEATETQPLILNIILTQKEMIGTDINVIEEQKHNTDKVMSLGHRLKSLAECIRKNKRYIKSESKSELDDIKSELEPEDILNDLKEIAKVEGYNENSYIIRG
eukprot:344123_1